MLSTAHTKKALRACRVHHTVVHPQHGLFSFPILPGGVRCGIRYAVAPYSLMVTSKRTVMAITLRRSWLTFYYTSEKLVLINV